MTDDEIRESALAFAKKNKFHIAEELTDIGKFPPEDQPISVFMAGSPGAGKTEFSKSLIGIIEDARNCSVIRIDADEIRERLPAYKGGNAYLFQGAASIVVEKIHDMVLRQSQTFILDGTLANYKKSTDNIERSLKLGRRIFIFYLHQRPDVAWQFTQAREATEGRNIPKSAFINQFINARETIERIHIEYGDKVILFLVRKNFEKNIVEEVVGIGQNDSFDDYLKERYTKETLEKMI